MSIFIFLVLLVGLIIVHECGHFFAAKLFGIKVDEFGVGFPPRFLAWRYGETEYSLNWMPFGGFVRIFGERLDEGWGDPRAFSKKSRFVQAAVVIAGVLFNFIFAWAALSAGFMAGLPAVINSTTGGTVRDEHVTVVEVSPGSPAQTAGFHPGDVVEKIAAGEALLPAGASSDEARAFIAAHGTGPIAVTIMRNGTEVTFFATPAAGVVEGRRALGIALEDIGIVSYPPLSALRQGGGLALIMVEDTAHGLWSFGANLFSGHADFSNVAGPVGIAEVGGSAVQEGYAAVVLLLALISINLGLINLIPVPGLDGGRLLFIGVEALKGSPVSKRLTVGLTIAGFALMAALLLLVTYHDIARLWG